MAENFPDVTQWPHRRVFDQYREEAEFAPVIPFDDNARVTERIFVEGRPRELDVGAPEFRKLARCERVSLYKNGSPPRPVATGGSRADNRLQRHQPLHRNGRDRRGKMQQINHRAPRQGKRNEFSAQPFVSASYSIQGIKRLVSVMYARYSSPNDSSIICSSRLTRKA